VTMDQRKRLMSAAKLGLGPLKQLGLAPAPDRAPPPRYHSRSRSPVRFRALVDAEAEAPPLYLPLSTASSRSSALPETATPAAARQHGAEGPQAAGRSGRARHDEDGPQDLDAFLAGGRALATRAAKAARERHAKEEAVLVAHDREQRETQAARESALAAEAVRERERLEEERKERERERRRQEEEAQRHEEERRKEERRRVRQEEKRRRRQEKAMQRELEQKDEGEEEWSDHASSDERELRRRRQAKPGGVFKEAFRGDDTKRLHWGESVKGRVSNDYKGFTDADLDRRFGLAASQPTAGEKLMTEQEVLAMLKSGRATRP